MGRFGGTADFPVAAAAAPLRTILLFIIISWYPQRMVVSFIHPSPRFCSTAVQGTGPVPPLPNVTPFPAHSHPWHPLLLQSNYLISPHSFSSLSPFPHSLKLPHHHAASVQVEAPSGAPTSPIPVSSARRGDACPLAKITPTAPDSSSTCHLALRRANTSCEPPTLRCPLRLRNGITHCTFLARALIGGRVP